MPPRYFLIHSLLLFVAVEFANGQPAAVVQLPTFGVSVDAEGVLAATTIAPADAEQSRQRLLMRRQASTQGIARAVPDRKVSLRRLYQQYRQLVEQGEPPAEAIRFLAGLQRIEFALVIPEAQDVVLVGPAEGWIEDAAHRVVGVTNGQPVLWLEDLITALQVCQGVPGEWFGCTIDPTREGLQRLVEVNRQLPRSLANADRISTASEWQGIVKQALGRATVRVFGLPPASRMGLVLVEADYRMKRMALGVEAPPVKMATFAELLRQPPRNMLQRWWLTPDPQGVVTTDDRLTWQLGGRGVQLQTENYDLTADGRLAGNQLPVSRASQLFADAFTAKYAAIAAAQPIFAELRNMIDLLILGTILQREDAFGQVGWEPRLWREPGNMPGSPRTAPRSADCVVNAFWRGNRLLVPAGGGVTIRPAAALDDGVMRRVSTDRFAPVAPTRCRRQTPPGGGTKPDVKKASSLSTRLDLSFHDTTHARPQPDAPETVGGAIADQGDFISVGEEFTAFARWQFQWPSP